MNWILKGNNGSGKRELKHTSLVALQITLTWWLRNGGSGFIFKVNDA